MTQERNQSNKDYWPFNSPEEMIINNEFCEKYIKGKKGSFEWDVFEPTSHINFFILWDNNATLYLPFWYKDYKIIVDKEPD